MKKLTFPLLFIALFISTMYFGGSGCNEDNPIIINPTYDSTILIKTLTASEPWGDTSKSGINFYELKLEQNNSIYKDAQFYDSLGERDRWAVRTGDLVKNMMGLQTKFDYFSSDLTKAQFDTVSKIYWDHTINAGTDFPYNATDYYTIPLTVKPVWSFYLKGRFDGNFNQGKKVYGLMQIDSLYNQSGDIYARINIKINKNETDQFNPYHN
jgi:hypothetical protein